MGKNFVFALAILLLFVSFGFSLAGASAYQVANTTMLYSSPDITTTLTNFPAIIYLDTTNTSVFNSNASGLMFTSIADNDTRIYTEYIEGWGTANTIFIVGVPSQTNSSQIVAWVYNTSSESLNYSVTDLWRDANYSGVWHMTQAGESTLIDSRGLNNLTEAGTCGARAQAYEMLGVSLNITGGCYYYKNSPVGLPFGGNPSTETARVFYIGDGNNEEMVYAYGSPALASQSRTNMLRDNGGSNSVYAAYANDWSYTTAQTTNTYAFIATSYNGTATARTAWRNNTKYTEGSGTNLNTGSGNITLGVTMWSTGATYTGLLDEFRIRNVSSTNDWVSAERSLAYQFGDEWTTPTSGDITSEILNSTGGTTFFTNYILYGWSNVTLDGVSDISYSWFMNGSLISSGTVSGVNGNSSGIYSNVINLTSGVAKNQNWILQLNASNSTTSTDPINSSQISISNSAPVAVSLDVTPTTSNTSLVTANLIATDADNDSLSEFYQFSNNSTVVQAFSTNNTFLCTETDCPDGTNLTTIAYATDGMANTSNLTNYTQITATSPFSGFANATVILISPPNGTLNATNPPTLTWENITSNDSMFDVRYQLCYNSTATFSQVCVINISSTNYTLAEQAEGAIITWAVQAYNASNTSDESNFSAQFYFNIGGEQPITPIYYEVPSLDELLEDYTRDWQFIILPVFAAGIAYTLNPVLSTAGLIFSTLLFGLALVFPAGAVLYGGLSITGFVASFLLKMAGR